MTAVRRGSFGSSAATASVRRRFGLLAGAVALGMGLSVPLVSVGAAAAAPLPRGTTPKPPPVPTYWYTGSEDMNIPGGGTVELFTHPDKNGVFRLTGPAALQTSKSVACGEEACVYNHLDWSVMGGVVVSGCGANTTSCDVKVGPRGSSWAGVINRQNNEAPLIFLLWNSDQPGGTISGYVQDEDDQGVPGASVTATGPSGGTSAVQAGTGFYAIDVKAGDYKVVPSGVPKGAGDAQYKPGNASVSLPDGGNARADFTLDTGMKVKLRLTRSSVPADGTTVVGGTLTVTEYGKAVPDAHVLLEPQPSMGYQAAVTSGARVAICNSGARVWPIGSLSMPSGRSVDVATDQNGTYDFTLTVGTVPGSWELRAVATNAWTGELSSATDYQTLDVKAPGTVDYQGFFAALSALKGASASSEAGKALATMVDNAASIAEVLAELSGSGGELGGLAFSLVNATSGGPAVFVYDDSLPPTMESNGDVVGGEHTWVLSPGQWKGTATLGGVLSTVMQSGRLGRAPTYTQWAQGTPVTGWSLTKDHASLSTTNFQYNGWAYPTFAVGACY